MTTAIVVSLAFPLVGASAFLALRGRLPRLAADVRGIALQTVIVMVVLLAIAGAVAAVLLTRGSDAISEVEDQNITIATRFTDSTSCVRAGFSWVSGACQ